MGLLDNIFGGGQQRQSGGMSGINLALMALLAYRTWQGKGRLADMLRNAGVGANPAGGVPPGGNTAGRVAPPGANPMGGNAGATESGGLGDLLRGGLGGLLAGGAAGGILSGGLSDLLKQFQQAGHGDAADSWISHGPNKAVSPNEVEEALGPETVNTLAEQAGMPREELLSGLSRRLPEVVDKLTPEGRLPTEEEAERWV